VRECRDQTHTDEKKEAMQIGISASGRKSAQGRTPPAKSFAPPPDRSRVRLARVGFSVGYWGCFRHGAKTEPVA
jgi:hypothetical protein